MKQLVLKLDVNDEQDVNIALDRIARISGKYEITMDKTSKLCTVKGDDIDPIQIVRKLRMLCHVEIVAVERPKEPEKKEEELEKEMVEVVNASSLAAAVIGPSKEPKKKEEELEKEEPEKKEEELVEVVNASSPAAAVIGPSKKPKKKEEELEKEEPEKKKEEMVEVVNASSLAAAVIGPSKEPKKKEDQLKNKEPTKQEEKKEGEEIITDVKEDPNKTFRAGEMKKAVLKLGLDDEKSKRKAMRIVSCLQGVDSISMDMKDKKMTVVGDIDPVSIVSKLRKICHTDIISVGPAKEPEKKKEEPGKHYEDPVPELVQAYKSYNPQMGTFCYVTSAEENPNACAVS